MASRSSGASLSILATHEYRQVSCEEAIRVVPFVGERNLLRHVGAEFLLREPSPHLEIRVARSQVRARNSPEDRATPELA